jgi:hypothetical protein
LLSVDWTAAELVPSGAGMRLPVTWRFSARGSALFASVDAHPAVKMAAIVTQTR